MNLHQFRFVQEAARRNLNLTETAKALHTSQPGISKQIRLLEEELGVTILVRNGKRITALTEPGKIVLDIAERILRDTDNLREVGRVEYLSKKQEEICRLLRTPRRKNGGFVLQGR